MKLEWIMIPTHTNQILITRKLSTKRLTRQLNALPFNRMTAVRNADLELSICLAIMSPRCLFMNATDAGLQIWQANVKIHKDDIHLENTFNCKVLSELFPL